MKHKKQGVSILMSFGVTLLVMMIAIFILGSVSRTLDRTANIERSNQVFYAAESGLEAAFFHANVRGPGVHFCPGSGNTCDFDDSSFPASLQITLNDIDSQVAWTIEGRANPVVGVLREFENVEIPLFWDTADDPTDCLPEVSCSCSGTCQYSTWGDVGGNQVTFSVDKADFETSDVLVPNEFFSSNKIMIDWKIVQEENTIVPFVREDDRDNPCEGGTNLYMCGNEYGQVFRTNDTPLVSILPGLTEDNMNSAFENTQKPTLSFQSPLKFEQDSGKIPGIPYKVDAGTAIPTPWYTATANVEFGDGFQKQVSVTVPHRRSVGAFSYVIFD